MRSTTSSTASRPANPAAIPAEDGVEMMKILDAVYESAATGHEVILK